jgi:hypothetical protein
MRTFRTTSDCTTVSVDITDDAQLRGGRRDQHFADRLDAGMVDELQRHGVPGTRLHRGRRHELDAEIALFVRHELFFHRAQACLDARIGQLVGLEMLEEARGIAPAAIALCRGADALVLQHAAA